MTGRGSIAFVAGLLILSACSPQVLELEVGTCFDDPPDISDVETGDVSPVDCDTPHDNEVFANVVIAGEDFPGVEAISDQASTRCVAAFEAYIGEPYETSIYDILWLGPSVDSWDVGDRVIICAAYDINGVPMIGTLAGIGQ